MLDGEPFNHAAMKGFFLPMYKFTLPFSINNRSIPVPIYFIKLTGDGAEHKQVLPFPAVLVVK